MANVRQQARQRVCAGGIVVAARDTGVRPTPCPKGSPNGVGVTVVTYDLKTHNHVVRDVPGQEYS